MTEIDGETRERERNLVRIARRNYRLWEEVKKREREMDKRHSDAVAQGMQYDDPGAFHDPPQFSVMAEIAYALIEDHYGSEALYSDKAPQLHTVIFELRRAAREDLGLPV